MKDGHEARNAMNLKKIVIIQKAKKSAKEFDWVTEHPVECQENFVLMLAKMNRNTLFGKRHELDRIRCIDDYQIRVSVNNYADLKKYINLIMKGERDVLFPGAPVWWAKTSGTTSEPKFIPMSREMTKYYDTGSRFLYSFILENPKENIDILSGKLLYLRAPSIVEHINRIPVGYISGITGRTQSRFAKRMVVPGSETTELGNWNDKFYRTVLETVGENVTMVVGVTPLLVSMFRRMAEEYPPRLLLDLKNEYDKKKVRRALKKGGGRLLPVNCWENLKLFCPSGASIKPYLAQYRDLFGDVPIREVYAATEGQFGAADGECNGLLMNWDRYLFEFLPINKRAEKRDGEEAEKLGSPQPVDDRLTVAELKVGNLYELLITNPFGLYSYRIGDIVRLESKSPYRFTLVGRTKMTLNVFGEKVCEEHVSTALRVAEEATKAIISEYSCTVLLEESGGPRYVMYVEFIRPPSDKRKFVTTWDKKLQEVAPAYGCFRANDSMLKAPEIVMLMNGAFRKFEEKRMRSVQASGQLKPPHIASAGELINELGHPLYPTQTN